MKKSNVLAPLVGISTFIGFDQWIVFRPLDDCYRGGTLRTPILPGTDNTFEKSLHECQLRCQRVSGCSYFSYWLDGNCILHPLDSHVLESQKWTSGPAVCGQQAVANESTSSGFSKYAEALWLVDGSYYDLEPLMARHPGGKKPLLEVRGSDASTLFRVQHLSERPQIALQKYVVPSEHVIGTIPKSPVEYSFEPNGFYMTVRERVRAELDRLGFGSLRKASYGYVAKTAVNILIFSVSWYHVVLSPFSVVTCLINAISRGVLVGIAHEAIHTNILPQAPDVESAYATLFFQGMIGFSTPRWYSEHVIRHHPHTKTEMDPDENNGSPQNIPFWRLTGKTPWTSMHTWPVTSHVLVGLVLPLINSIMSIDKMDLFCHLSDVRRETAIAILFLLLLHLAPLFFKPIKKALLAILLTSGLTGLVASLSFHVSHLNEAMERVPFQNNVDWGANQMHTTSNFASGYFGGVLGLSGGLDNQIEHHLFPMLSKDKQLAVKHIVEQTAKEFELPYVEFGSWSDAVFWHLDHMVNLGKQPSDTTTCANSMATNRSASCA